MSEDQAYKDGDIVWVKLGNNWWPGEVIDATRHPDGTVSHIKRKLYCIVKFFNEDAYEYVSNVKQIYPFQSAKKEEFLKKGFSLYNSGNKFMEKFPEDVKIAERLTRQKTPSLFINDRPDSIVKAILGQPIVLGGSSDGYGGSGAESVGGGNSTDYREKRRSCESITKIMNITPNKPKMGLPSPSLLSNSSSFSSSSSNNNAKNISTGDSISNRFNVGNNNANNNNNNYRCNLCGFTSVRQNVMILHRKSHSNRNSGGIGGTMASPHQNKTNIIDTNTKANKISVLKPSLLSTTTTTATSSTSIKMTAASKTLKTTLPVVAAAPRVKSNNDKVVNESFDSTKVLPALRSAATTTTTILISDTSSSELDVSSIDGTLARRSRRHTRTSASKTPPPAVVAANTPATIVTHNVLNGSKTTIKPADFLEQTKPIKKIPKKRDFASLHLQDAIENAVVLEQEIPLAADIIADAATSDKTSATATKGNAEEIRNMLLADWSDEDETPDLEIGDDKREKSTKKDTKCATDSTVATATTSTPDMRGKTQNTSRIRNIPKKDRRNVILDDFNNDLSVIEPVASSSEINLADSSNSSSTAEVVEIVEQEQPEGETEAIITINDDDDGDEKEAALQEGMDKCKPTNQDKHSPQNVVTSRHSDLENHEPNDKSLTTSVLSCFDFQDDDEDEDIDAATNVVNTSVAHFKKKYLCNEKSLQPITTKDGGDNNMDSSHDKQQQQQHEERAKQDQDLAAEIESLLEQTQPPAAADLIISRKASFEEGIAVKDLPIKERSKRIFKSRNRSRVVESKSSTESRTNSLSTDESLTKDNSSTVAAAIMEDITPKKPLVEDKSTRISSEQDKGYGQQHNGKNSKPCESMVGEANNETTPENLIEAATIQTLTKLAWIEENETDDFNSEEMDVEKTHLNPGNKTRNNSLICLEDDIVAIIKQEKVNAEETAQKITTAQETEERSPKGGDEDEDEVCENQISDNTPVTNQEIEVEHERAQGAPVIEDEVLKETQIEEEALVADKPIDKVQEVDLKQTILDTVVNENEEEHDEAIEEHLDTQITEIPVTTEESEITTENAAETPGITMAEKKEHFTSDVDQLLTEDLPQQRQAVNTSPLDENSSLCASDTGAEFGSPASMLSEERLPAYPFSRNETPQPMEGNEIALAESESNDDDAKKQQSEVKEAEIIESKANDCSETKENVLTTKNRRRRLRGCKANSSKRKDLLKKSAERLKNSHQEEVAKDFVDSQEVLSADTNSIQDKPQRQQEEDEEAKEETNYCETTSQEDTEKSKDEEEEEVNPSLEVNSSEKVNEEVSEDCIGESISCAKDASTDAVEKGVEICDTIENTKEASIETFEKSAKVSDERESPIMLQEFLDQDVPNKKPGNQTSNDSNETESETMHINDKIEDSETNDNVLNKADINNAALEKVDEDNLQIPMEMSKCIKDLKETNDDEEEIVTKELGAQKSKEDENQLDNEANELRNDDMQLDDILSKKENSESSMEYGKEIDTAILNDSAAVTSLESKKVLGTEAEAIQVEDITKNAEDKEEEKGNDMKADESKLADVLLESQRIVEAIDALEANMQKKSEIVTNLAENEDIMETPTDEKSHTKTPKKRGGDIIMPIKSKQRKQEEEEEEVALEVETLTNDLNKEEIFTECEKDSLKETEEPPESKKMVEDQNMESITTTNENLPTLEDATDSDIKENKEEETSWPIEETEISAIIEKALSSESHKATIDGKDAEASREERSDPKYDHNSQTVNEKKNDESEATTKPNPSTTEDLSMESLMEKTTTDYLKEFDKLMNQNQEQNVDNENEEIMKNIIIEVQMDNNVCRRIDTLGFTETIGDNESKSATSQKPTVSKTIKRRKTICFDTSVRPSSRKGPVYDFEECPPTTTTFATATTTTTSRALKMKPLKRTAERKMTMPDIDRTTRRCEFARELKTTCKSRRGSSLEDNITSFLLHRPSSGTHDEDDLVQDLFSDDTSSRLSMDAANVNTAEIQPRKLSTLHEAKQHNRNSTTADSNAPTKTPNGRNMKRKASQNKTISQRSVADNHPPQNKMARDVTATQSDHLKISDNQITTAQQQLMQLQQQQPQNQSSSIILNTQTSRTRKPHKTTAAATTTGHNQQPPPQNGNQLVVQQQQMQQQQQQVITQLASPQNIVLQPVLPQQANEGFIITTAGSREDENVIDSNTQLIALPTQPYPGYTETFLLCKVNGNTCKPVDNVPLYLNHQLNELVPIPAEVLEAGPKLIVADTSLNDSKEEEEEDGNTQEAIMEQNKSHHNVLHRGGHKNDNSPGIHIANVTADEEDGDEEDGGVEGSDVGGTGIQQDFMDDITEANTNATMECTEDTANNGILLNIEGQQVLLDAATFAHLLANPDTNTQLISEDGTEYVLTHEVLQALYMQQQQQQQQHNHEQQVLEIANAAAGAGVNNDIIAVAMAGSDLYDNGVLTIDTTQALQLIEDGGGVVDSPVDGVIFQQATPTAAAPLVPPPHLTPPAVVTNAVLDQSPIMSTLEVPTNSRTHCISVPSTMAMVAPSNVVMGEVGGTPTNLDDSLAAIGVTAQSSSISSSLGLPITVTDPNIASKVTSAGPLNEILQFVSHRPATSQATAAALATAALAGESRIFND
ncbi:uncharacterized protein LOC101894243 [Musca domestica]|uniref:Uncharacterized protein LOC101894243 n=1 Tax=Musca domestica TaxID=7370 RepID=A0ABM3UNI8_MUSDO|nr:uncharacterized protein LOC101894243 [Musca domestica]